MDADLPLKTLVKFVAEIFFLYFLFPPNSAQILVNFWVNYIMTYYVRHN